MDTVATLLGHPITLADVSRFVIDWGWPTLAGLASSYLVQRGKQEWIIGVDDRTRTLVLRGAVALLCTALNLVLLIGSGSWIGWEMLGHTLYAYFVASAAYVHRK